MRHVREVPTEKAEQFCKENGLSFVETSAKDNENVEFAFEKLITQIYEERTANRGKEEYVFFFEETIAKFCRNLFYVFRNFENFRQFFLAGKNNNQAMHLLLEK